MGNIDILSPFGSTWDYTRTIVLMLLSEVLLCTLQCKIAVDILFLAISIET